MVWDESPFWKSDGGRTTIRPTPYDEIFFSDAPSDDRWFRAKLNFITLDEKSGKEKRTAVNYLVQGSSLQSALKNIEAVMGTTMVDYVVVGLTETLIMDVFEYTVAENKEDKEIEEFKESWIIMSRKIWKK